MEEARQEADRLETGMERSAAATMLHRASKLIGKEVTNVEGKELGSIHDLVLTPDHEQISYAVLSRGGWWGIGNKLFAIPWPAFTAGPKGDLTLAVSEEQLKDAKGFKTDNWPAEGNMKWLSAHAAIRPSMERPRSGMAAGEQMPSATEPAGEHMDTGRTAMHREIQRRRVTNLTGLSVLNKADEDIGNVEDFVIDPREGRIVYTIVSFGGFWGIGEKYAAVPSSAVTLESRPDVARLDADRQTLESVAFKSGDWPDLSDRSYAQRLHEAFNAEPYWVVFGYVSPEEQRAVSEGVWGPESEYGRHFNAEHMTSVTGTVQSIGTFHPEGAAAGVADGIRLRLTTEDGNLVTVHAGPQAYFQRHRFSVKPGDKITVTGSNTKIGWRSVLIATQIKTDDRTLELRTETGAPLWNERPGEPAGSASPSMGSTAP